MKLRLFLLFVLALPGGAASRPYDLDVAVPPGTPIEWLRESCRTGRGRGDCPRTPDEAREGLPRETSDGTTPKEEVGKTTSLGLDFGATDPFAYARVLTQDIAGHLAWVSPTPGTTKEEGPVGGGIDAPWSYPPLPSDALYWYVLAAYLRRLLHPALMSESETIEFLIELGEPSLIAADHAKGEKSCEALVKAVRAQITPLSTTPPDVRKGKNAFETMLTRLATEELTSGFAYELNPYFAERTLSFGSTATPILIELAHDKHPFLARNATAVLAGVADSEAGDALLKLARETKDQVIRNRAVSGLIRRRHPGAAEYLRSMAKGGDLHFRSYAIYGLGLLGDKESAATILEAAKKGVDDADVLWSAIPALGRLRDGRDDVTKFLREQEGRLSHPAAGLWDAPPDPNRQYAIDSPGTKARAIWEMTVIALARRGDEEARKKLLQVLEEGRKQGVNPRQRLQPSAFSGFLTPSHYALLETLLGMGKEGTPWLQAAVDSETEDPAIQLQCLLHLSVPKPDLKLLGRLIGAPERPAALRALALRLLAESDPKEAERHGREILALYATAVTSWADPTAARAAAATTFVVTTAMHILGALGKGDPKQFIAVADRALADAEAIRKLPKPVKDPRMRWYQKNTMIIRAPVLEVALYELGRTRSDTGVDRLLAILKETTMKVGRGEAALALGVVRAKGRHKEIVQALAAALADDIGWVRWCASRGLKAATDIVVEVDWIYGTAAERSAAVEKVRTRIVD